MNPTNPPQDPEEYPLLDEARHKAACFRDAWPPTMGDCPSAVLLDRLVAEVKRLQMDLKFATAKAAYFEHDADCCGGCIKCLQLSRELDAAEKAREA